MLFLTGVWAASGGGYFWPVWPLLVGLIAVGVNAAALLMTGDRTALTERISTLEESRAGAVDVQEAELRRIERDLHDGAQARLVALGMSLGMAEQKLATEPEAAAELLADARAGAGEALRELRDLARGIHPPVLADRGLDAAVRALAAASPDLGDGLRDRPRPARSRRSRAPPTSSSPRRSRTRASTPARAASTSASSAATGCCRSRCTTTAPAGRTRRAAD